MKEILLNLWENRIIKNLVVIAISMILYTVFKKIIHKRDSKKNRLHKKLDNRTKTYIKLFDNILKYTFLIATLIVLLKVNGVNVSSMLAGIGIVSVVVGLALQDALKDIIMGANIITDHFFSVGDVIKYKEYEGKVIGFGLKTTTIEDVARGNIISISNRNIFEIEKVSNKMYFDIPVPYEVSQEKMAEVGNKIADKIKEDSIIDDCKYQGLNEFKDSNINYRLEVIANPELKYPVKRLVNQTIKAELDANNISIPYMQVVIHND